MIDGNSVLVLFQTQMSVVSEKIHILKCISGYVVVVFFPLQPPIHPFFKLVAGKVAIPSGKGVQTNLNTSSAASNKPQRSATKETGKEEQIPSPKVKPSQGQGLTAKPSGITIHKESSSDSSSDSSEEEAEASTTAKHETQPGKRSQIPPGVGGRRISSETLGSLEAQ